VSKRWAVHRRGVLTHLIEGDPVAVLDPNYPLATYATPAAPRGGELPGLALASPVPQRTTDALHRSPHQSDTPRPEQLQGKLLFFNLC
jgi:hypothetical protein